MSEPLLIENRNRFCLFPIKYHDVWEAYKRHKASFWTAEEIDFTADKNDWDKLNEQEKYFIEHILAFFAGSDGIVLENLITNFCKEIPIPEVRCFYTFQAMIENIHCVTADTMILTSNGYHPIGDLTDKVVQIWNGDEFSEVKIMYTGDKPIYQVELSNGIHIKCSENHKWLIDDGNEIPTTDLKPDMQVMSFQYPYIDIGKDPDVLKNPYTHGFFCGDPIYDYNKKSCIILSKNQYYLLNHLSYIDKYELSSSMMKIMIDIKSTEVFVPINYSKRTQKLWLEGLLDSNGHIENHMIIIHSKDKQFLRDIQLMLTTFQIFSSIDKTHHKYVLSILSSIKPHLKPRKIELQFAHEHPTDIYINNITKLSDNTPTYCFNEPKKHRGIFNGILTCQSEVYSLLIETYVSDPRRKTQLFNAIEDIPCVQQKAEWAIKYIDNKNPFAMRLLAFGIVEGLFFSGAFCAIFWLKERGIMTKSLGKSNEWICRDEGLHLEFAILLYKYIVNKVSPEEVYNMMKEAVEIEDNFICNSLPCRLLGMNQTMMKEYIQFVADRILIQFGYNKLYDAKNPFPFMNKISLEGKTNFFEQRVTEYVLSSSIDNKNEYDVSNLDEENF